jgi:hypothetical protein
MRTAVILGAIVGTAFCQPTAAQEWTTFVEPELGTRLELPSDVFTVHEGPSSRGIGEEYRTSDGRAALAVYSQRNLRHETPRRYLHRNYRVPRDVLDYVRVSRSFFAVSGVKEGTIYYSRCNFSRNSRTIHCFDVKYPAHEKRAWDEIVTRISRSLASVEDG